MDNAELFSEVLETKVWNIKVSNNTVICLIGNGSEYRINIHELAHKCKEWARINKYFIYTYIDEDQYQTQVIKTIGEYECKFYHLSEPQAIFKACQWILDNKEN